ncbi:MAG TPA: Tab2/Atab2 family RNA-binding protein, partial [Chroococcidiopsis sp.]
MTTWQADFYRRPLNDETGSVLWELVVCDATGAASRYSFCPQSAADSVWLGHQLQQMANPLGGLPKRIQVFRPQSVSLLTAACQPLGVIVEPTRHTPALKRLLRQRA